MDWYDSDIMEDTEVISRDKLNKPSMFKVLLHNDDYTTMDFVVYVLENVFHKSIDDAYNIMMKVHKEGIGLCGIYTAEIAETKVTSVHQMAKQKGFPLKCSMEEE